MANSEAAVREGHFFDLMYVNLQNPELNPHRHFAFMRNTKDAMLLIIVNFDSQDSDVGVHIPEDAFKFIDFPQGEYKDARELLSSKRRAVELTSTEPFRTHVPAHGAVIWKILRKNIQITQ